MGKGEENFYIEKNIKTCWNTSINRKLTSYVVTKWSVVRGVANYFFEIKITSKHA